MHGLLLLLNVQRVLLHMQQGVTKMEANRQAGRYCNR